MVDGAFANLSLYFLLLVYLAIVGFAGLCSAVNDAGPHAFSRDDLSVTPVTWIYFSMATISTLGFGDVHPTSTAAQIAVGCQIATGPLLLSWLLPSSRRERALLSWSRLPAMRASQETCGWAS